MKALLASALTALVFVTAAWASNVTPAQLTALSKRVAKLERQNAALAARVDADEADVAKCVAASYAPMKQYEITLDLGDASPPAVFKTVSEPNTGDAPEFYVPVTTDTSCLQASSARSRAK